MLSIINPLVRFGRHTLTLAIFMLTSCGAAPDSEEFQTQGEALSDADFRPFNVAAVTVTQKMDEITAAVTNEHPNNPLPPTNPKAQIASIEALKALTQAKLERGQALFDQRGCAKCHHASDRRLRNNVLALRTSHTMSESEQREIISHGITSTLSSDDLDALYLFLASID